MKTISLLPDYTMMAEFRFIFDGRLSGQCFAVPLTALSMRSFMGQELR